MGSLKVQIQRSARPTALDYNRVPAYRALYIAHHKVPARKVTPVIYLRTPYRRLVASFSFVDWARPARPEVAASTRATIYKSLAVMRPHELDTKHSCTVTEVPPHHLDLIGSKVSKSTQVSRSPWPLDPFRSCYCVHGASIPKKSQFATNALLCSHETAGSG